MGLFRIWLRFEKLNFKLSLQQHKCSFSNGLRDECRTCNEMTSYGLQIWILPSMGEGLKRNISKLNFCHLEIFNTKTIYCRIFLCRWHYMRNGRTIAVCWHNVMRYNGVSRNEYLYGLSHRLTLSVSASSAGVTIGFLVDGSVIFMIAIQLLVINFDRFMW